jgi:uncharacterized protein YndB with AHSA1/START domain
MDTNPVTAKAEMLIRKPVAEVFEAFVDPEITSKFWFTKGSARLEPGREVTWEWEMHGASAQATVIAVEPNKRILIEWSGYGTPSPVEWVFTPVGDGATFVSITNTGFTGTPEEIAAQAVSSTEGFTIVLAGLKALFEHSIDLSLVTDRFPDEMKPA